MTDLTQNFDPSVTLGGVFTLPSQNCEGIMLPIYINPPIEVNSTEWDFTNADEGTYWFTYTVETLDSDGNVICTDCTNIEVIYQKNNPELTIVCQSCPEPISIELSLVNDTLCAEALGNFTIESSVDGINWTSSNKICT